MNMNIVRAKKDTTDRQNLSTEKQAPQTENPPCEIELTDADLESVYGGDGLPVVGDLLKGLPILGGK